MLEGKWATEVSELERAKGDLYMSFYPVPMINCSIKYVNFKKNERKKKNDARKTSGVFKEVGKSRGLFEQYGQDRHCMI